MRRAFSQNWIGAVALLMAAAAAFPLFAQSGFLNTRGGGDSPFLLQRLHQLTTALADGHFPVRWMPDANYGYGYPFYNYYAPLSLYLAAVWRWLGFDSVTAVKLTQALGFLAAGGGMYGLARRWFADRWAALLASAAYTTAPFHLVNVYVRGDSLAEFWAMAFYPLTLWAAEALLERPNRRAWLALATSYAALVLSHNISALIFTPFLALYILLRLPWRAPAWRTAFSAALTAGLLGLALSAWFWLPAIGERGLVQLGPVTEGYFHYSGHFRAADLVQWRGLFDYDVADGGAFRMGLAQTAVGLAGLLALAWRRVGAPPVRRFLWAGVALATLMITPFSEPLWARLPLLAFTQFPWRFLSVQALLLAGGSAGLALAAGRRSAVAALLACAVLLTAALGDLRPDFIAVAEPTTEALVEYEWFTGNIGTTISAEYLPVTVQPRPFSSPWPERGARDEATTLHGLAAAALIERRTARQTWQIDVTSETAEVVLPLLAWPGWTAATAEGTPLPLTAAPGSGLALLSLPQGSHRVLLQLTRTPLRLTAELLSLAAVALVAVVSRPIWSRRAAGSALALVAAAVIAGRLWPQTPPPTGPLTWDFVQAAYLHAAPDGVRFANGARLLGYQFAPSVAAGAVWELTLDWEAGAAADALVELVTPAATRATAERPVPTLTAVVRPITPGRVVYRLSVPATAPAGLYLPRLTRSDGAAALTTTGAPRGALYLAPVRVQNDALPVEPTPGDRPLEVQALGVEQLPDGNLLVRTAWRLAQPTTRNYQLTFQLDDSRTFFYAKHDGQPGYGMRPTSNWPAGEWVADWTALAWVADDGVPPYTLTATLYDLEDGGQVLVRRLGRLTAEGAGLRFEPAVPRFTLPPDVTPLDTVLGGQIRLGGYTLEQSAGQLRVTLYWQALAPLTADYRHFVHLTAADGRLACPTCQHDGAPQLGAYPTSQWLPGEWVDDPAVIDLQAIPPGRYTLRVGLYQLVDGGWPRLPVVTADGSAVPDAALSLPDVFVIPP